MGKCAKFDNNKNALYQEMCIVLQNWCQVSTDQGLKDQILLDFHSPGEFRIKGPLSNNQDFARDLNCPKGSKMNPEKKCRVW